MIGWALRQAAILSLLGLGFYALVNHFAAPPQSTAVLTAPAAPTAPAREAEGNVLTFRANRQGHVVLDAMVNGAPVQFLVDTGATMVTLTMHDAETVGISRNELSFTTQTMTANGPARVALVHLRDVRIGQLSIADVPAQVAENLGISLLGQSFLTRLNSYEMRDGVLTLSYW